MSKTTGRHALLRQLFADGITCIQYFIKGPECEHHQRVRTSRLVPPAPRNAF